MCVCVCRASTRGLTIDLNVAAAAAAAVAAVQVASVHAVFHAWTQVKPGQLLCSVPLQLLFPKASSLITFSEFIIFFTSQIEYLIAPLKF